MNNNDFNLDEQSVKIEADRIMNQIDKMGLSKKSKINKKYILIPIFITIFALFLDFNFMNSLQNNGDYLKLVRVSANEYKLQSEELNNRIEIYTLVENEELIKFNDNLSVYSNFSKYVDVSSKVDMELFKVKDQYIVKATIDKRLNKYFLVYQTEQANVLFELDYRFTDFDSEMTQLFDAIKLYPPVIEKINHKDLYPEDKYDYYYDHYQENIDAIHSLDPNLYSLYSWYVRKLDLISYSTSNTEDLYSSRIVIYMDGNVHNLGNVNDIHTISMHANEEDFNRDKIKDHEFPILINQCEVKLSSVNFGSNKGTIKIQTFNQYTTNSCTNETYKDTALVGFIMDFNNVTNELDLNDYEIIVKVTVATSKEIVIEYTKEDMLIDGNRIYIIPKSINYQEGSTNIQLIQEVMIKDNDGNQLINRISTTDIKKYE